MATEVRRTEFPGKPTAWGEQTINVRYEFKCPDCGVWTPLTLAAAIGLEIVFCRGLGCVFKTRYDFTPFVDAIEHKRLDDESRLP